MWVVRELDKRLYLCLQKPVRTVLSINNTPCWDSGASIELDSKLFPNISWEDEPLEVELVPKGAFDAIYEDLQKAENLLRG